MRKYFTWILFIFVASLSLNILEGNGVDTQSREIASKIEKRHELIQQQTHVMDSNKLGALHQIHSLLDTTRGPSSIQEIK